MKFIKKDCEVAMVNLLDSTKSYLNKINKVPSLATMTPTSARRMRTATPPRVFQLASLGNVEDLHFTARDGAQIPVRIYTPNGEGPFPVIIYYHGGGWVLNDLNTCHESCGLLANKTQSIVISVEYRLAPEFKFPIPVNDAHDAFLWAQQHVQLLNGIPELISVSGDSAGGNLAIAVSKLVSESETPNAIAAQLLLYPVTDLSYSSASYKLYEKGYSLDKEVMEWFGNHYIRGNEDTKNPLVAPLQAKCFAHMPPAFIVVAENDVLRDEAIQYGEQLHNAGIYVEVSLVPGVVHSFFTHNETFAPQITTTIDQIDDYLQRHIY